ncbi:hypothetical protein QEZ54_12430 [Catellatospora sp. KI3]|uniref:hypothetical protein n=1 Tax=Catellatospora sp. KI3 TaxID=3041620 RepID=UPI002483013B|nr:hypothetical protein [Catellatospora sp. KI3]MDI1461782.1 hypothetical protein [Catellatospora sp. KI3]
MTRPRLGVAVFAAAATALVGLSACGSSDEPAASGDTGGNPMAAYTDCLKQQGITLPDNFGGGFGGRGNASGRPTARPTGFPTAFPTDRVRPSGQPGGGFPGGNFLPEGVTQEAWQKAQEACASVRPSFGPGGNGFRNGGRDNGANAAYRNCLAEHGVQFQQGQQLSTADPAVVKAMEACAVLRPSASPAAS